MKEGRFVVAKRVGPNKRAEEITQEVRELYNEMVNLNPKLSPQSPQYDERIRTKEGKREYFDKLKNAHKLLLRLYREVDGIGISDEKKLELKQYIFARDTNIIYWAEAITNRKLQQIKVD